MIKITGGKGFHITFENGYTVSVQFGPGNYCDHYDRSIGEAEIQCGKEGSLTAEVAYFYRGGDLISFGTDTVKGWQTVTDILQLFNKVSSLPPVKESEAKP